MPRRVRHVVITGASRGIGLAVAQLFARSTYRCTLIARSENGLKSAVAALERDSPLDSGVGHSYIAGDIASSAQPFWSSTFTARWPRPPPSDPHHPSRIDVLVNCAGVSQASLLVRTPDEDVEQIINLNLTALIKGSKFLLRQGYIRGGGGGGARQASEQDMDDAHSSPVIVNVASLLGLRGGFGATSYAASKAGVLGFTRALASEYSSHRVRVNAVVPGYISTDMTSSLDAAELCARIPLGRFGTAEEVARAVLFLAEMEYAHNCVVNLDGGLSAV
ncbi:3-oxoacyl-reductase [Phaeosphaeria sp. MPI-PUGE-AT-0046c]|nr:3-oxoacyl-reductase [Phaeosphaeria sp. MPI-PUGE-AT-0046c]